LAPPPEPLDLRDAPAQPWYRELSRGQWTAFGAAWLGYLLDGFDFVLITLVLTQVRHSFGLSAVQAASLVSAAFVSRWAGGLLIGGLADRHGRRAAMVVSVLLFSVGTLGCGLAPGYGAMFAARLVVGLGMAGEYSASSTYVIESWPRRMRNRASGFLISGYSIGAIVAAQAYRFVVPAFGWRALFFLGLAPIALALWLRRGLPESAEWSERKRRSEGDDTVLAALFGKATSRRALNAAAAVVAFAALLLIFTGTATGPTAIVPLAILAAGVFAAYLVQFNGPRWRTGVALTLVVFTAFLASWPLQALLPTYLKTTLGYGPARTADVLFAAGFGAAVGCWVAGFAGDRFGTRRAYVGSLLVGQVAVLPVFAVGGRSALLLGVLLFVQQVFGQGVAGLLPKWIGDHFDVRRRAAALGFVYNVGALGGAVAPPLGAGLAGRMSLGTALAVLSFAGTGLVALLIGIDFPRRFQSFQELGRGRRERGGSGSGDRGRNGGTGGRAELTLPSSSRPEPESPRSAAASPR
jgi:MFS transporter, SHS family, sialic acid transporter